MTFLLRMTTAKPIHFAFWMNDYLDDWIRARIGVFLKMRTCSVSAAIASSPDLAVG